MAIKVPSKLKEVADQVIQGNERKETVRTLLSWFGTERRGYWKVREIRRALNKVKLTTEPDFEETWVDASIAFLPRLKPDKRADSGKITADSEATPVNVEEAADSAPIPKKSADNDANQIKIGMLTAANLPPLCVSPDTTVSEAVTLMLQNDYSQLPVTTSVRDLKGIISWKSLGSRLALGRQCGKVSQCMEAASEIQLGASLFDAIPQIVEHECVLVRDVSRKLTGIVTTADLSLQFAQLGEPFLLLGQIENYVRTLIADKYSATELRAVRDPSDADRDIEDVSDLTFGEYIRLLENPKHWDKLALKIDRKTFVEELRLVGRIRNNVMHFDPDGQSPEDLTTLRKFARFLNGLEKKLV